MHRDLQLWKSAAGILTPDSWLLLSDGSVSAPGPIQLHYRRHQGYHDDQEYDLLEVLLNDGHAAQGVAQHGHHKHPAHAAAYAERQELQVRHLAHSRHEGGEGSNDRHEPGDD